MSLIKIQARDELISKVASLKAAGKKVVFTSGTFDLLHRGHVEYLEKSKALGDFLIVGINTDESVRSYKDPLRPIVSEQDRAVVVAALASVDAVFLFSETNNNQNINILKPDVYVKAGDYTKEKLSSAGIVESYGGTVALVALSPGHSSSNIIDKIAAATSEKVTQASVIHTTPAPAVFLDRDGTINQSVDYLSKPEEFELIPGVLEALKSLQSAGYKLIVTTNQPGISLGYFSKQDFYAVNRKFMKLLTAAGITIDKIYFCPHSDADRCECRKPEPGMIKRAAREMQILLDKSFVIGDMTADLKFGENAGVKAILVETGLGGKDGRYKIEAKYRAKDLKAAAGLILSGSV